MNIASDNGQSTNIDPNTMMSDAIGNPAGQVADMGIGSTMDLQTPAINVTNDEIAQPTTQVEQSLDPNCDPNNPSTCQDPVAQATQAVSAVAAVPSTQEFSEPIGCASETDPGCAAPSQEIQINGDPNLIPDDNNGGNTNNNDNNDSNPDNNNGGQTGIASNEGMSTWVWWVIAFGIVFVVAGGLYCKRQMEISKQIERAERHQAHG